MHTTDTLEDLRQSIDRIDSALCALLAERFAVTQKVGEYKAIVGLPPVDENREAQKFKNITTLAVQYGLEPEFAAKFLQLVMEEVVQNHRHVAASHRRDEA